MDEKLNLHLERTRGTTPTGGIVAALGAVWFGLSAMIASHIWSLVQPVVANMWLLKIGSWIPGWERIGSFAGKETIGLLVWLYSWVILNMLLKNKQLNLAFWLRLFVVAMIVLLICTWPVVYHTVVGWKPNVY
jgi:hypothetical protein